jgi:hypothetical protein
MPRTAVRLARDVYATLEDLHRRYGDTFTLPLTVGPGGELRMRLVDWRR